MGIILVAQPADIVSRREDQRHAVVNYADQLVGVGRDDCEGAYPLAGSLVFPVLPQPAEAERAAVFHGNRTRLLGLLPLERLPLEEAIDRYDAAPPRVGVAEGW